MSQNDVEIIAEILVTIPKELKMPFKVCFLMASLYILIENVTFVVLGVFVFFIIVNYLLAQLLAVIQKIRLRALDIRLHKLNEAIDNIKTLKLNSWVEKYMEIVNKARNSELVAFILKSFVDYANNSINELNYPITAFVLFGIAIFAIQMTITVPIAMAVKQVIKQFKNLMKTTTAFFSNIIELLISMDRIQDFLNCEEADLSAIEHKESNNAIKINNSCFFWGFDKQTKDPKKAKLNVLNSSIPNKSK